MTEATGLETQPTEALVVQSPLEFTIALSRMVEAFVLQHKKGLSLQTFNFREGSEYSPTSISFEFKHIKEVG